MESLWNDFNLIEKIFAVCGLLFTLLFLLQMVLSLFGADHDHDASGHADASVADDAGIPFQFITLKNMVTFFAIFGWTGLVCLRSGMTEWLGILIAFFAGLLMMTIMATLVYFMSKLADEGNVKEDQAIGKTADVYLVIPGKRSGQGKISIHLQGRLLEYQAITDDELDITTGSQVRITDMISNKVFIVTKI